MYRGVDCDSFLGLKGIVDIVKAATVTSATAERAAFRQLALTAVDVREASGIWALRTLRDLRPWTLFCADGEEHQRPVL